MSNHKLTTPVTLRLTTTARVKRVCDYKKSTPSEFTYACLDGFMEILSDPQYYSKDIPCPRCHGTGVVEQAVSVDVETHVILGDGISPHVFQGYFHDFKDGTRHAWGKDELITALLDRYEAGEAVEGITIKGDK